MVKPVIKESDEDAEVLVLLSGGIDSSACLHFYKDSGRKTCAMFIDYEQSAVLNEDRAAKAIAAHYGVQLFTVQWRGVASKGTGRITARNAFFLIAALMECSDEIAIIATGVHAGTEYADCSEVFIERMQSIFDVYTEGAVQVGAPFADWSKGDIFAYATANRLPIDLTHSCEEGGTRPCGKCLSCLDREALEGYA